MDWHALTSDPSANTVDVVFHIPIPQANNRAGKSYRTALVKSGIGGQTVMPVGTADGEMTAAEKAQIDAGEIFEVRETIYTHPGENATQLRAKVDARYTELVTKVQAELQRRLTYWGHAQDAP